MRGWRAESPHLLEDEKPVVWRLLSNRRASTLTVSLELIGSGAAEKLSCFFNILKNGAKGESLTVVDDTCVKLPLAFCLITAWRIGYLMRLGRSSPEMDSEVVLEQ